MNKIVVITGAGSGIGAATAVLFSKNGWHVALLGRNIEKLEKTQKLCSGPTTLVQCDLSDNQQIKSAVEQMKTISGSLHCIINNAGIFTPNHPTDNSIEPWLSQFQTNLFGAVSLTLELLPLTKSPASIVNVSSTLGLRPTAETSAYSASKAAMINWTQALALALGPKQIRVNVICPGLVDTPIHSFHNLEKQKKTEALNKLKNLQPLGRIGSANDIAKSIFFLGSDDSLWTTGAVLSVDGGINLT